MADSANRELWRGVLANLGAGLRLCAKLLWTWPVLSAIALLICGGLGVGAMYGGQYRLAAGFYFAGIALLTWKAIAHVKGEHRAGAGTFVVIFFLALLVFASSLWLINHTSQTQGHQTDLVSTMALLGWGYALELWQWPWRWILIGLAAGLVIMATVNALRDKEESNDKRREREPA